MGMSAGAEPETRRAVRAAVARAVVALAAGVALVGVGLVQLGAAPEELDDLEATGDERAAVVLDAETVVPGLSRVSYAHDDAGGGERVRADLVTRSSYERGQTAVALVDPTDESRSTLDGEVPRDLVDWVLPVVLLLAGAIGTAVAARRAVRTARLWSVARSHPWSDATLQAAYPKRRRMAVSFDGSEEEHLIGLDRRGARRLAGLERRAHLLIAGSGHWFVVSPAAHRSTVVLVRMDEPYERFRLINPGAAPDRFDRFDDQVP